MGTVVARAIKDKFPNSHFTLGVNKRYADMVNLFKFHPYIDDTHVWEAYDNWPGTEDVAYMRNGNFDIVLSPMPQHPNDHCWYNLVEHQTEAACIMNGFSPPKDLSCFLNRHFDLDETYSNHICIAPFTAWGKKNISLSKWEKIVNHIKDKGFKVIQLGQLSEAEVRGVEKRCDFDYFQSVKVMLSSNLLVCLDGGLSWAASAYKHPTVGLYGYHYNNLLSPKMYEPLNPNATYLEAYKAEDIDDNLILDTLNKLL